MELLYGFFYTLLTVLIGFCLTMLLVKYTFKPSKEAKEIREKILKEMRELSIEMQKKLDDKK